jgi:type VI secretion system secreted protein Hcp
LAGLVRLAGTVFLLDESQIQGKNSMVSDNFMWIPDGQEVVGETTDQFFQTKGAFELTKFSFKISASDTTEAKGGGGAGAGAGGGASKGKAKFGTFSIDKWVDLASASLYQACCQATIFPSICLAVVKTGGDPLIYMQYLFRYNQITGIDWDGGTGQERPKETITFSFKAMGMQYVPQLTTGGAGVNKAKQWSWNTADQTSFITTMTGIANAPAYLAPTIPIPKRLI